MHTALEALDLDPRAAQVLVPRPVPQLELELELVPATRLQVLNQLPNLLPRIADLVLLHTELAWLELP